MEIVSKQNRTEFSIMEALERVGLQEKLHSKVYTLSGGRAAAHCFSAPISKEMQYYFG